MSFRFIREITLEGRIEFFPPFCDDFHVIHHAGEEVTDGHRAAPRRYVAELMAFSPLQWHCTHCLYYRRFSLKIPSAFAHLNPKVLKCNHHIYLLLRYVGELCRVSHETLGLFPS